MLRLSGECLKEEVVQSIPLLDVRLSVNLCTNNSMQYLFQSYV